MGLGTALGNATELIGNLLDDKQNYLPAMRGRGLGHQGRHRPGYGIKSEHKEGNQLKTKE